MMTTNDDEYEMKFQSLAILSHAESQFLSPQIISGALGQHVAFY